MVFKNFRINCIIRLGILSLTIYLFYYFLFQTDLIATTFVVGILSIVQVFSLFHYIESTNSLLTRFLQSIRYSDFTQSFTTSSKGSSFTELNEAFGEVINEFQKARTEKEEHFRYLQTIVQHVGVGLIAFKRNGEIGLLNNAAKRLLDIVSLNKIDEIRNINPDLYEYFVNSKDIRKKQLKFKIGDSVLHLSLYSTSFILRNDEYTLVSLQNIFSELEEKEMEAWQNLIRTLTHEIINSITPISSLASTANAIVKNLDDEGGQDGELSDVKRALSTIEKRSMGLIVFVENYRKLTKIPKPKVELIRVSELFERVHNLMNRDVLAREIDFSIEIDPETLEISGDPALLEQVLINLVKNASEAVVTNGSGRINLQGSTDDKGNPIVRISDNGQGIDAAAQENIFIPFFTTKKDGSGIGLSFSKQVMRLHHGTIEVFSNPGEQTEFTLRFKI